MKRTILTIEAVVVAVFVIGAAPAFAQRLRAGVLFEYGTASNSFGLDGGSFFGIPYQNNNSSDGVISANLEYVFARRWPLEVGLQFKGSFGFSEWNLGTPSGSEATDYAPGVLDINGIYGTPGAYLTPDDVHISAEWWALAAMLAAHVHLGSFVVINGAVGYGPYGYFNVNYWDDLGLVTGSVSQNSGIFPSTAWSIDWSAGLGFGLLSIFSLDVDVGMMGPDFVTGLGVTFPL